MFAAHVLAILGYPCPALYQRSPERITAVNGLELQAADGEMIALLGGSGCGKTTTLRMIAGFLDPDAGTILVNGRDVSKIPPYKRNIGIFFPSTAVKYSCACSFTTVAFNASNRP